MFSYSPSSICEVVLEQPFFCAAAPTLVYVCFAVGAVTGPDSWGLNLLDGLVVLFVHLGRLAIAMNLLEIRVID